MEGRRSHACSSQLALRASLAGPHNIRGRTILLNGTFLPFPPYHHSPTAPRVVRHIWLFLSTFSGNLDYLLQPTCLASHLLPLTLALDQLAHTCCAWLNCGEPLPRRFVVAHACILRLGHPRRYAIQAGCRWIHDPSRPFGIHIQG